MTEKRYVQLDDGLDFIIKDIVTGKLYSDNGSMLQLANEQHEQIEKLSKKTTELKALVEKVDNELEERDIVIVAGKFRLEEWGKKRYHQFYDGDKEIEDETVVVMLMELNSYKMKVADTLQKHYNHYTNMAVELRHDKYSNGACHNVLEVLEEIADELGIDVDIDRILR